ncbi:MAG: metallophosphoesterase family protein [Candidatus Saliniplasma sp.]
MNRKISVLAILFLIFFSFYLHGCLKDNDYSLKVEGGIILQEDNSKVLVRSYSTKTEIDIQGFKGEVMVTNCNDDSKVKGIGDSYEMGSTNISLKIDNKDKQNIRIKTPEENDFKFAVIGDTQGMNHIFKDAVKDMKDIEFLIHLGDLTSSGKSSGYNDVERVMNSTGFPVYTTIGNHDVRFGGTERYKNRLAPVQYSFTYSNYNFIFLNSAQLSITEDQIDWMESKLSSDERNIIITHAPYYDPFSGSHTMDDESSGRIVDFIEDHDITAYVSGHIHAYYQDASNGTRRLITGGGGGSLVKGEHHYISAEATQDSLEFTKVPIKTSDRNIYNITVKKGNTQVNYSYQNLLDQIEVERISSFQNQFGNKRATGYYEGIKMSTLIEDVGGMSKNDTLLVESIDGYLQKFGYLNVYPDEEYMKYQGEFILGLEYNNQTIDEWGEGPRAVMMPDDGYYSNDDCANTSYPDQGWNVYESAGARWAKYVKTIEVIKDG